jgi:undecaprenyl-diphosphatase
MTLLLVLLNMGTMFAVIVYFWPQWRSTYFQSVPAFKNFTGRVVIATAITAAIGEGTIQIVTCLSLGRFAGLARLLFELPPV